MNRDELIHRLKRYEWSDVEFKEARNQAPKSAYETVSAFANTAGGWLPFGVRDNGGVFEIVGVIEVDKVQGEFLSTLRSGGKVNRAIAVREDVIETDGRTLLVFHIPESLRSEKPIYLNGDIRRSFIRRGGCDERCTSDEIERFLRDASADRLDERPLDGLDAGEFFDPPSVRSFRRMFDDRNPGRGQELSDDEFLQEWGFVVGNGNRLAPTRAAVLHLRNPAIVTAFRRIGLSEQAGTGMRAIFRNWQSLGHVPPVIENDKARKAFELRLLRQELLSDQQQEFQAQLGVQLADEQARVFAFACRNGRVSLTDAKAVTGRPGPEAREVLGGLVVEDLLRPLDDGIQYGLAGHLRHRLDAAGLGQPTSDQVTDRSRDMVSDHVGDVPERNMVTRENAITDHVGGAPKPHMVTDHVIRKLTAQQRRIVAACDVPRSLPDLMERAGAKHRTHFRRTHLLPLVRAGIVTMTNPEKPRAVNQRYILTDAGVALRAAHIAKGKEDDRGGEG